MESWREELYANSLMHYGVKGMKWGRQRVRNVHPWVAGGDALSGRSGKNAPSKPQYERGSAEEFKNLARVGFRARVGGRVSNKQGAYWEPMRDVRARGIGYQSRKEAIRTTESELKREIANERLRDQKQREREDNTYKTSKEQRRKYKLSRARNKIKKLASKFGINIKQYK